MEVKVTGGVTFKELRAVWWRVTHKTTEVSQSGVNTEREEGWRQDSDNAESDSCRRVRRQGGVLADGRRDPGQQKPSKNRVSVVDSCRNQQHGGKHWGLFLRQKHFEDYLKIANLFAS